MIEEWLIDTYNLLHAWKAASPKSSASVTPEKLYGLLAGFASARSIQVLAVLDGSGPKGELEPYQTASFRIVRSKSVSADAFIERTLYENRATRRFVVVTDDRAIATLARGGGAQVLKTASFLEILASLGKENSDVLFDEKVRGHGFNRPFEDKLRKKGLI